MTSRKRFGFFFCKRSKIQEQILKDFKVIPLNVERIFHDKFCNISLGKIFDVKISFFIEKSILLSETIYNEHAKFYSNIKSSFSSVFNEI